MHKLLNSLFPLLQFMFLHQRNEENKKSYFQDTIENEKKRMIRIVYSFRSTSIISSFFRDDSKMHKLFTPFFFFVIYIFASKEWASPIKYLSQKCYRSLLSIHKPSKIAIFGIRNFPWLSLLNNAPNYLVGCVIQKRYVLSTIIFLKVLMKKRRMRKKKKIAFQHPIVCVLIVHCPLRFILLLFAAQRWRRINFIITFIPMITFSTLWPISCVIEFF